MTNKIIIDPREFHIENYKATISPADKLAFLLISRGHVIHRNLSPEWASVYNFDIFVPRTMCLIDVVPTIISKGEIAFGGNGMLNGDDLAAKREFMMRARLEPSLSLYTYVEIEESELAADDWERRILQKITI
jgi:hypothetical protein